MTKEQELIEENKKLRAQLAVYEEKAAAKKASRENRKKERIMKDEISEVMGVSPQVISIVSIVYPNYKKAKGSKVKKYIGGILDLIKEYPSVDHYEVAKEMERWCLDKSKEPGLGRYHNFVKNSIKFAQDRARGMTTDDLDILEQKTKERIKELDHVKQD